MSKTNSIGGESNNLFLLLKFGDVDIIEVNPVHTPAYQNNDILQGVRQ